MDLARSWKAYPFVCKRFSTKLLYESKARTRAQSAVGPLELLAWRKVFSLGVDTLEVIDVALEAARSEQ